MTVLGPIEPERLGVTLVHEHILVDFVGAEAVNRTRYDAEEVFAVALPHLQHVRDLGCQTLVECTPAYIGRDAALLQRLARASGLNLITNTGYYGAAQNKFLPRHAFEESEAQLAARWVREWQEGIEGTGIRPGFIKIGVDSGPLSDLHRRLVRAAARAHLPTGLTIASHTGDGFAALDQLRTLREEGVAARAFIWVHAQNEADENFHFRVADLGAWVEFDWIAPHTVNRHVELVDGLRQRGLLHRVLISHDAGWYHVGEPNGGEFRPYDTLFTEFVFALRLAGYAEEQVSRLLVANPCAAFTRTVRAI